ncbi:DUF2922 domain-containing protein [Staphylococcus sp. 11261D007BR]
MNTKALEIIFENENQKPFKLTIPNLAASITKEIIEVQAKNIIKSNVLTSSGGQMKLVKSAQIVDKIVTVFELN